MLDHLIFDVTDAQSRADSANVGAHVRAGDDGTLIGHVSDALKVSVTNASIAVTATNLDIRDLTQADEITVFQGTSPWVVSATDLDIRDLDAAQDSVESWTHDGAGNAINSTSNALHVHVASGTLTTSDAALANTAVASTANTLGVADTAEAAVASPLASRKYLFLYNNSNKQIFVGGASVSAANGFPVSPGSYLEMRAGAASPVNFVGRSGETPEIRTLELS